MKTRFILLNLSVVCRCLETSSWMMGVTSINITILRPFSAHWCFSSGGDIVESKQDYFLISYWVQQYVCPCFNNQGCHRGVLAGNYAFLSVRSGVWTRPLHCPPHHIPRPWGRLWNRVCLLLLCLIHLSKLIPGQDSSIITLIFIFLSVLLPSCTQLCFLCPCFRC